MKHIVLTIALSLIPLLALSMEVDTSTDPFPWLKQEESDSLPPALKKALEPATSVLYNNYEAIREPEATLSLQPTDQETLRTAYQALYERLALLPPERAKQSTLRMYKQLIYTAAQKMHKNKDAAKQWLKTATYYTDEEKELNPEDNPEKKPTGRDRRPYYQARRALNLQAQLIGESEPLKIKLESLAKDRTEIRDLKRQLLEHLAQVQELLSTNEYESNQLKSELESTSHAIGHTHNITAAINQQFLQQQKEIQQEITILENQIGNVSVPSASHKKKCQARIAQHQAELQAIQRDLDLLRDNYTLGKKLLWKLSGLITSYPVQSMIEQPDPEDEKES